MKSLSVKTLKKALEARKALVTIASKSMSPHIGSSLSHIDIITTLYSEILNINRDAEDPTRDRFILSKGHAALGYYIILAQHGFIPMEEVENYAQNDTRLAAHPVYASARGLRLPVARLATGYLWHLDFQLPPGETGGNRNILYL